MVNNSLCFCLLLDAHTTPTGITLLIVRRLYTTPVVALADLSPFVAFFLTAHFSEEDYPYDWLMLWLSRRPEWQRSREFETTTRTTTSGLSSRMADNSFGDDDDGEEDIPGKVKTRVVFQPTANTTHTIYYRGHWLRVRRGRKTDGSGCEVLSVRSVPLFPFLVSGVICSCDPPFILIVFSGFSFLVSWREITQSSNNSFSKPKRSTRPRLCTGYRSTLLTPMGAGDGPTRDTSGPSHLSSSILALKRCCFQILKTSLSPRRYPLLYPTPHHVLPLTCYTSGMPTAVFHSGGVISFMESQALERVH